MNLELSKMRDLSNEIEELRSQAKRYNKEELIEKKNKIKQLALFHRDDGSASLEEVNKAIAEIEGIDKDIAKAEEISKDIEKKEKELNEMRDKYSHLNTKITGGEFKRNMNGETEKVDIRKAFAKHILQASFSKQGVPNLRAKELELSESEKRALGVATTTTSETFVQPTTDVDGINNGGIFIPNSITLEILRDEELISPIYNAIRTTAIKGLEKFPYRVQMTPAKNKAELVSTENKSVNWGMISGRTGNYTDSIVITFEEEAMAVDEFTEYLISLIREGIRDLLIKDYIYGSGEDNKVRGLTYESIKLNYTSASNPLEALENGIKKMPAKKRAGAKIYVAQDIFDNITFQKDNNGNYILPILNGGGLNKISTFQVEADPYLNDGDFIIGNIGKNYKANVNKAITLGLDVINYDRIKIYSVHAMITATPLPSSFVYGKLNV